MSVRVSVILDHKGSDVATISQDASTVEALRILAELNVGALVVSDDRSTVDGIVSERDIVRHLATAGADALELTMREIMTAEVSTCTSNATTDEVMQIMSELHARHLPVVDSDSRLIGIVSIGDVVKSRIDELTTHAQSMETYISGTALA